MQFKLQGRNWNVEKCQEKILTETGYEKIDKHGEKSRNFDWKMAKIVLKKRGKNGEKLKKTQNANFYCLSFIFRFFDEFKENDRN